MTVHDPFDQIRFEHVRSLRIFAHSKPATSTRAGFSDAIIPCRLFSLFAFLLILGMVSHLQAQQNKYYFYHPENDFGSELVQTPLVTFLNGGFDVLRNGSHRNNGESDDLFSLDYRTGFENVWDNISHPLYHIRRYGWNKFLSQEVFPTSLNPNQAQWLPNYGHHILGSGMLWVRMAEWYDYHRIPHPYLMSAVTTLAYQFLNEALENNHSRLTNVDPIADMLIFNPLGFLVFSFHSVRRFFSQTVQMYDWSLQPVFNPFNQELVNAGTQFALKYKPPFCKRTSLFLYYGIYGIAGLSYDLSEGRHISVGAGTVVNRLNENVIRGSRLITPNTDGAIGIFYDRNHSLLLSALMTGPRMYNLRLNIYPGLLQWKIFKPGAYLSFGEWDGFSAGITFAYWPVGIAGGNRF